MEEDVTMVEATGLMEVMEASYAKKLIQSFLSFAKGNVSSRLLSQSLKFVDLKARMFSKRIILQENFILPFTTHKINNLFHLLGNCQAYQTRKNTMKCTLTLRFKGTLNGDGKKKP